MLHMTKVAVGCASLDALARRVAGRTAGVEAPAMTRFRPKRAEELVGGSLYWIVRHQLIACQQILRFDAREDGRIDIVCSAELVTVAPRHCRAHQGWRYLEEADAPCADDDGTGVSELPPKLYGRLAELALV